MQEPRKKALFILLGSAAMMVCGCGRSLPETAIVRGQVTVGTNPLTEGMITFFPEKGRAATSRIEPDGTFRLTTFKPGDGAILGQHRVTIDAVKLSGAVGPVPTSFEEELVMGGIPSGGQVVWLVPQEYATLQTTKLTAEVKPGENEIDFDLPAGQSIAAKPR